MLMIPLIHFDEDSEGGSDESGAEIIKQAIKSKKRKKLLIAGGGGVSLLAMLFGIAIIVVVITAPINALGDAMVSIRNFFNASDKFVEEVDEFLIFGDYKIDAEETFEHFQKVYQEYNRSWMVYLDIPVLMSTIYYDGDYLKDITTIVIEDEEKNKRTEEINKKVKERLEYIDELAHLMVGLVETKKKCERAYVAGEWQYFTNFVSSQRVDQQRESKTCSEETDLTKNTNDPNDFVYEYQRTLDVEGYYEKLLESEIFEVLFPEAVTEREKRAVIDNIRTVADIWKWLWEHNKGPICFSVGTIPTGVFPYIIAPVHEPYRITSRYGYRAITSDLADAGVKNSLHNGTDIVADNKSILSVADGVVESVILDTGSIGNVVTIRHEMAGKTYWSNYKHLADNSVLVSNGQMVVAGQQIATMGSTGISTGVHLHFEFYTKNVLGAIERFNPENLFNKAENYEYECVDEEEGGYLGSCSVDGAIAVHSRKTKYSFNLLRAIITAQNGLYSDNKNMSININKSGMRQLWEASKNSELKTKVLFDTELVYYSGSYIPFSDINRSGDRLAIREVIKHMTKETDEAYNNIYMGPFWVSAADYASLGFKSAKEAHEAFDSSAYTQVVHSVNKIVADNPFLDSLFKTFDSGPIYTVSSGETMASIATLFNTAEREIMNYNNLSSNSVSQGQQIKFDHDTAMRGIIKIIFRNNENWIKIYEKSITLFAQYKDDPTSTNENFLHKCLIIEKPGWEDCSTYENKTKCKNNLKTYAAKANELYSRAPTAIGKRVLAYALSLWGKVRYCSACSGPECTDLVNEGGVTRPGKNASFYSYQIRCPSPGAVNTWNREGFNKYWSVVRKYYYPGTPSMNPETGEIVYKGGGNFEAAVAGLDCMGYANWVLANTFQEFPWEHKNFTIKDTPYMIGTRFKDIPGYKTFADVIPMIRPGDFIKKDISSDGITHIVIYMGYDDHNGNRIPDGNDDLYLIHTGDGSMGVEIFSKKITWKGWEDYISFGTYK